MRRRLDVAASMVGRPKVLFLDEPTTGIDPRSRMDLWTLIQDLVSSGTTILLTTQYLDEADQLAARIGVIDDGRLITEGTPEELKDTLGGAFLELAIADADRTRGMEILKAHRGRGARVRGGIATHHDHRPTRVADAPRRGAAPRRSRDRTRGHHAPQADPGRRLPGAHRPLRSGGRHEGGDRQGRQAPPGKEDLMTAIAELAPQVRQGLAAPRDQGHAGHHQAQPAAQRPTAPVAHLRHGAAGDVPAALQLRVRRRHRRIAARSTASNMYLSWLVPGLLIQVAAFGAGPDRHGTHRGPQQGRHRAIPVAPDGPLGGAGRANALRPGPQRLRHHADDGGRLPHRVPLADHVPRPAGRDAGGDGVRLRTVVGDGHHRPRRQEPRGRPVGSVPPGVPVGVRLVGVRARCRPCRPGWPRSPRTSRSR